MNLLKTLRKKLTTVSGLAERGLLESKAVTYLSPRLYLAARSDPELVEVFDHIRAGSWIVVRVLSLTGVAEVCRESFDFSSLAPVVLARAEESDSRLFCIGGKAGEIEAATTVLRKRYPGLELIGYRGGYFDSLHERTRTVDDIVDSQPDIVLIGMGPVLQESFAKVLRRAGYEGTIHTCGAFFTQLAEGRADYHSIMDQLELRWLERAIRNRRVVVRLVSVYPRFILAILWDAMGDRE